MAKLIQRKGRSGWYLHVSVPFQLRPLKGKTGIYKKAGNTYKEAVRNAAGLEHEIRRGFEVEMGGADVVVELQQAFQTDDLSSLSDDERSLAMDLAYQDAEVDDDGNSPVLSKVKAALDGQDNWERWIERRVLHEGTRKGTVTGWRTALGQLATYARTERLQGLTKADAVAYKEVLLKRISPATTRKAISTLSGFWNWAKDHGQLEVNIWEGLSRKLPTSRKKPLPEEDRYEKGVARAIEKKDWRYLLMKFTGCRKGEASGLRHCDINMKDRTVAFVEYEQDGMKRLLKGDYGKDERTVPMSSKLYEALQGMELNNSTDPIWPKSYRPKDDTWGANWSTDFKSHYGFTSHDLRRRTLTVLGVAGVSPFIVHCITKQAVPGLSKVIEQYTRPSVEQLRETMELL